MIYRMMLAAAMVGSPSVAHAQHWQLVSHSTWTNGQGIGMLVDMDSVRRDPGTAPEVSLLIVLLRDEPADGKPAAAAQTRVEFECAGHQMQSTGLAHFDAMGTPVDSLTASGRRSQVPPELAEIEALACRNQVPHLPSFEGPLPIAAVRDYLRAQPATGEAPYP